MTRSYSPRPRPVACLLMGAVLAFGAGCARRESDAAARPPAAPGEVRHPLKGEVVDVSRERKALIVLHDEIKGYMPRMTMEFRVTEGDLAIAKPGQRIRAELVERKGEYFLERIWPDDPLTNEAVGAATKALTQDTAMRGRGVYREVGETAPDFTLLDQEGRAVAAHRFRGKHVVVNFIFTRCPIATMCPAATTRMMALQDAARQAGRELELVSISLDPEYDTPGVLKEYAAGRGIDTANFTFLTGPDAAVRNLLAQLGVIREFEGETIKHTLATVLIDPAGRIIHRVDGSAWDPAEFLGKVKQP